MKNCLIAAALLLAGSTLATTNDFLTWEQCLERTKSQSPELVSARAAVRELEYGVVSASAGFLPQISASAGISRGQREVNSVERRINGVVTNDVSVTKWRDTESSSVGLNLSQDLFSGGENLASRRRAFAQRAGEDVDMTRASRLARKTAWKRDGLFDAPIVGMVLAANAIAVISEDGTLTIVSPETGDVTHRADMPMRPAWDSLVAAYGKLFFTTKAGEAVCLGD